MSASSSPLVVMLNGLKVSQLKAILTSRGVSTVGLLSKDELVDKIIETDSLAKEASDFHSPATAPRPSSTRPSSRLLQLAGRSVRVVDNRGSADPPADRSALGVLLLHGFGANKDDLVPFAESVLRRLPDQAVYFYAPDAPVGLGGASFGWWPLDLQAMMIKIMTVGLDRLFDQEPPPGLDAARAVCETLLAEIRLRHARVAIGGFSQGSMLAVDLCLRSPPDLAPHVLFVLSGACVCPNEWARLAENFRPTNVAKVAVLQTHGTGDQILPYSLGLTLSNFFQSKLAHAAAHTFAAFTGPHTIPPTAADQLAQLFASSS